MDLFDKPNCDQLTPSLVLRKTPVAAIPTYSSSFPTVCKEYTLLVFGFSMGNQKSCAWHKKAINMKLHILIIFLISLCVFLMPLNSLEGSAAFIIKLS